MRQLRTSMGEELKASQTLAQTMAEQQTEVIRMSVHAVEEEMTSAHECILDVYDEQLTEAQVQINELLTQLEQITDERDAQILEARREALFVAQRAADQILTEERNLRVEAQNALEVVLKQLTDNKKRSDQLYTAINSAGLLPRVNAAITALHG